MRTPARGHGRVDERVDEREGLAVGATRMGRRDRSVPDPCSAEMHGSACLAQCLGLEC